MTKKALVPLFCCVAALGAHGASVHTGLLSYWPLDGDGADSAGSFAESTGSVADTMAPGATGASIVGSGGLFGGAGLFDRDASQTGRLAAADSVDLNRAGQDMTISLWLKFDSVGTGWQALVSKGEGANYRTAIRGSGNGAAWAGGTGDIPGVDGPTVKDGAWHHVLATTTNGAGVSLFVDGALQATGPGPAGILNVGNNYGGELWIGNNPGSDTRMWDGMIDDVAIWDRALTDVEAAEIYTAGASGFSLAQIPEPGTGILGALAGLALLRRRRR